jgi:hypothetical protein
MKKDKKSVNDLRAHAHVLRDGHDAVTGASASCGRGDAAKV